jgi:hypothetical protein
MHAHISLVGNTYFGATHAGTFIFFQLRNQDDDVRMLTWLACLAWSAAGCVAPEGCRTALAALFSIPWRSHRRRLPVYTQVASMACGQWGTQYLAAAVPSRSGEIIQRISQKF